MRFYEPIVEFINHYRSLFLNPAGNSTEIVILTSMLVIGVIILWLGTGALITGFRSLAWRLRSLTRPWLTLGLFVGGTVGLAAIVFGGTYQLTNSETFCGRLCHSMNPQYQSWRRSAHADVGCSACHADKTLAGRLDLLTHGIALEASGEYSQPINKKGEYGRRRVPDDRCEVCHQKIKNKDVDEFNLRIEHEAHVTNGIRCADCHNRVAHPGAEKYSPLREEDDDFAYKDNTLMAGCKRCHKKGGRYVDADGDTYRGPYKKADGTPVAVDCESCHPNNQLLAFEADVKRVRARHFKKPPWRQGEIHGETARKVDFEPCKVCHDPAKRCTVCHQGITMPHKASWISPTEHGAKAKQVGAELCKMCHTVGTVPRCAANGHHHEPFVEEYEFNLEEADWKSGKQRHGVVAKATNGSPCYRCHDRNTWCSTQCHQGISMTHDSNWRNVHFTYVTRRASKGWPSRRWQRATAPCVMCHARKEAPGANYCNRCHHKKVGGPGVIGMMRRMKRKYGVTPALNKGIKLPCGECHIHKDLNFCRDCHRRMAVI